MIHMRKRCLLICLLAVLMMLFITVASADTGKVTASSLILREEATSDSKALYILRNGAKVNIESKTGRWYKVNYGKYEGYVYSDYIEIIEEAKSTDRLVKGDSGDAVKALQKRLTELGYYSSSCDGNFGAVTEKAVKAFQKMNGLTQDGVAGPVTLKRLESTNAIKADGTKVSSSTSNDTGSNTTITDDGTLKKGDKGAAVKELQQRLKELGYYTYSCDSSYGNRTVEAVKAFQKRNGLTQDGVAGPVTIKKLNSSSAIPAKDVESEKEEEKDEVVTNGTLKKGDKGDAVKKLQQRLKELGYYTPGVDGDYGYRTVESVKAFQKKNGLTQDGVAGPTTQAKLYSDSAVSAKDPEDDKEEIPDDGTLQKGDKGDAVKKLQQRLKELGYYTYGIDSSYGNRTVEAVKAFQKKNGLTQDGVAGPSTQAKLYSDSAIPAKDTETDKEEEDVDDGTLQKGDKGDAVKKLQQRLKELGYYTYGIDSSYGNRTLEAVKAFQKKNGLTQDGVAGPSTQAKLYSDSAIPAKETETDKEEENVGDGTLKKGDKGDAVKKLQQRLKALGYYTYGIDSSYGNRTVEAVKAFQKKNNLTVDGIAGPTTQTKLYSDSAVGAKDTANVTLATNQTLKKGDSGAQVKALQTRLKELGYYTTTIDSDYGYRTASAVSDFQRLHGLNVTGTADSTTLKKLVSSSAMTKAEAEKAEQEKEETYVTERLDWFKDGEATFPKRAIIKVKDCRTGLIFNAKVLYGTNHLDVEPLTAADTAILLQINGGVEFSYKRRPMLVQYDGHVYAASIYSEPHGDQTILDNNFEGQFCLHFYGSKLHKKDENGNQVVDPDHKACEAEALKYTW